MKRIFSSVAALVLFAALVFTPASQYACAEPERIRYAYMPTDTVLYRAEAETYVPVVVLPATYFVALLTEPDSGYVSVSYLDLTGFVAGSTVEVCEYTPVYVCADVKARPNNDGLPINLRDKPNHTEGKILATVPDGVEMTLYGSIAGSALIPAVGDEWHYVKYTDGNTVTYGYVYAGHTQTDPIPPNTIEKMPETPLTPPDTEVVPAAPAFDTKLQIIFIVALCVPAVAVMLLLFRKKPDKKKKQQVPRGYEEPQ